ncbi:peptidase C14 [Panus rudis PR-1116 ss-1]|nr:peptidase C14 [Panus rudis PR-1116 ss-1]
MAILSLPTRGPIRRALSISIRYTGNEQIRGRAEEPSDLKGTHFDTDLIVELLTHTYGWKAEQIKILRDDGYHPEPTFENIIQSMEELVADSQPGDEFLLHFSGHGSQVPDDDGDEIYDGLDEVIWPVDVELDENYEAADRFIRDDDIKRILVDRLPPRSRMFIILDCCHSGSAADLGNFNGDYCPTTPISPIADSKPSNAGVVKHKIYTSRGQPETALRSPVMTSWDSAQLPDDDNSPYVTCWAACKDPQTTLESENGGLFVKAITRALSKKPQPTHGELLRMITREMSDVTAQAQRESVGGEKFEIAIPQISSTFPVTDLYEVKFPLSRMPSPTNARGRTGLFP